MSDPLELSSTDAVAAQASARFVRAAETFEKVRNSSPAERERLLEELCSGDAELLVEVRSLLAFHDKPSETLDSSILKSGIGAVIGRYRISDVFGEGGMGTVYLAVQEEPVRREVALKVIKLGMDTRQIVRRFEAERQAIAQMEHPNVARVLDAGATADGRPYFVMELVRGRPLTSHCDKKQLAIRERLRLFLDVCSAVQHAHQKGVIHRDLKPSNILVAELDGKAMPKVIDFGVAKALLRPPSIEGGERTVSTLFGDVIGTPDYMSPEQAAHHDIDVRSDVYALGVLLYELLAGLTPLRARLGASGGEAIVPPLEELRRIVREQEPVRPVNALATPRREVIARNRSSDARSLERLLSGDLAWIVLKALALSPARRYPTVAAFAEDIERYLADQPVTARAPSAAYTLTKFARRHTVVLVAACLVVVAILAGLVLALIGFERARAQRDIAIAATDRESRMSHTLRAELFQSDVDRGRQRGEQGHIKELRDLLWSAYFAQPSAPQARWALRELMWSRGPFTTFFLGSPLLRCIAILPDGTRAVAGSSEGTPALLDSQTGSIARFSGPTLDIIEMQANADGSLIVCGDYGGTATLWDVQRGEFIRELYKAPRGRVAVAFDDQAHIIASGNDGSIHRIAIDDPTQNELLAPGPGRATHIARSSRGAIAVGYDEGSVVVLDPPDEQGARKSTVKKMHERGGVVSLAFDAPGARLASASFGREYRLCDAATLESLLAGRIFPGTVKAVKFSADGTALIMPGWWDTMTVDIASGKVAPLTSFVGSSLDISADGAMLAYPDFTAGEAALVAASPDSARKRIPGPKGFVNYAFNVVGGAMLQETNTQLSAVDDEGAVQWSLPVDRPRYLVVSREGTRIATLDAQRHVLVQSIPDGAELASVNDAILGEYGSLNMDPTGNLVTVVMRDNSLRLIDLRDGSTTTLTGPSKDEVIMTAFSPDSELLVYSQRNLVSTLLNLKTKATTTWKTEASVFAGAFTADGKTIAQGMFTGDIMLYDVATGKTRTARGHSAFPSRILANPVDPDLLLSCADDGSVRVWHCGLARELMSLEPFGPRQPIRNVDWDARGERILVAGPRGDLLAYRIADADRAISASEESERARLARAPQKTPAN